MALGIISCTPEDGSNNISLDSGISIEFSQTIDPFTVPVGVAIYKINPADWIGTQASKLDTNLSDVRDVGEEYTYIEYSYSITGNTVNIIPSKPLDNQTEYYIQIVPGSDSRRFISTLTTSQPEYTRIGTSTAEVNITSSYTGKINSTYELSFIQNNSVDIVFDGSYKDTVQYTTNIPFSIGELNISVNGIFDDGDVVSIDVFKATGLSNVLKTKFTTSEYIIEQPQSKRIEDKLLNQSLYSLNVVSTIPASMSLNNSRCNPVIIKFSHLLDPLQDIYSRLKIFKLNSITGSAKRINYYYKITGDTIKIYLVGVDSLSEVGSLPIDIPITGDYFSSNNYQLVNSNFQDINTSSGLDIGTGKYLEI